MVNIYTDKTKTKKYLRKSYNLSRSLGRPAFVILGISDFEKVSDKKLSTGPFALQKVSVTLNTSYNDLGCHSDTLEESLDLQ